ncbi:hypothetical protein HY285_01110, partial [Candidatus Peregrinibacteria bacterium]|nr:hypothetical protein [Candidatus Peregrinibacteria bacterium]
MIRRSSSLFFDTLITMPFSALGGEYCEGILVIINEDSLAFIMIKRGHGFHCPKTAPMICHGNGDLEYHTVMHNWDYNLTTMKEGPEAERWMLERMILYDVQPG